MADSVESLGPVPRLLTASVVKDLNDGKVHLRLRY